MTCRQCLAIRIRVFERRIYVWMRSFSGFTRTADRSPISGLFGNGPRGFFPDRAVHRATFSGVSD